MKPLRFIALSTLAALSVFSSASAHRMWMLPSTFTLSGEEQWITVDGAISNDLFFPNHVPLPLSDVAILAPDGEVTGPENGWTGKFRSAFDVKLDKQGTWKITETGKMYFVRWEEAGEERRKRGSLQELEEQGYFEKPDAQFTESSRRIETFVTLGAPTTTAFSISGVGLEMLPVTHPNDIFSGETVEFLFLAGGNPAVDVEVEIVKGHDRYRDDPNTIKIKTDKDGRIVFTPQAPGQYWLSAGMAGETRVNNVPMHALNSYVAVFEALAP